MEKGISKGQDIIDFINENKLENAELVLAVDNDGRTYIVNSIESYKNLPNTIGFNIELEEES